MATRSWRKRMTLQRWERLRGIDFSRSAPCVELSQKTAVVLCPLSEFPKGMTNALTDILFRDQAQTIERLRQTGWLEEITDEKGMLRLRLTERGILSMYQSRELVWTWERMDLFAKRFSLQRGTPIAGIRGIPLCLGNFVAAVCDGRCARGYTGTLPGYLIDAWNHCCKRAF